MKLTAQQIARSLKLPWPPHRKKDFYVTRIYVNNHNQLVLQNRTGTKRVRFPFSRQAQTLQQLLALGVL